MCRPSAWKKIIRGRESPLSISAIGTIGACDFKAILKLPALKSHTLFFVKPVSALWEKNILFSGSHLFCHLIDSYKVFNSFHIGPITTFVHYLKPICYEEYKGMKTQEIADLVKIRIEEKIQQEMQAHR